MKATVLTVGTEILFGEIVNTNAVYLSQELNHMGISVLYHHTVGDNTGRLSELLKLCFEDTDLVITTGGLGPTQDDLTKETICAAMKDHLVLDQPSLDAIKGYFASTGRTMTPNNEKQAYVPSRSVIFPNACGTAPGFALENEGKIVICLPGPPTEMKDMFQKQAVPYLQQFTDGVIYAKMVKTFGIGESALETAILDLVDGQTDPTLATYAKPNQASIRIASKRATREEAEQAVNAMLEQVKQRVGQYIYATEDKDLYDVLGETLLKHSISFAVAESCTGGLFAGRMTDIPGISQVFERGIVTYSNRAKQEELGVREETLLKYGAVSEETAREMAEGLAKKTGCRLTLSVTGIAGPSGGTPEKPVGLIYIGCCLDGCTTVRRIDPSPRNSRSANRLRAMDNMAHLALQTLSNLVE